MATELSPKQALAIYYLLFTGKTPSMSKVPFKWSTKEREALVMAGLIKKVPAEKGATHLEATENAWEWAESHLGKVKFRSSKALAEMYDALQVSLKRHADEGGIRLAELLAPTKPKAESLLTPEKIRAAYLRLVDGALGVPVRISKLGLELPNVEPSALKDELVKLRREQRVSLSRSDDPLSTTDVDRLYEIDVDGATNHFMAFKI